MDEQTSNIQKSKYSKISRNIAQKFHLIIQMNRNAKTENNMFLYFLTGIIVLVPVYFVSLRQII